MDPLAILAQAMAQMAQTQMQTNALLEKLAAQPTASSQPVKKEMTPEQEAFYQFGTTELEYEIRYQLRIVEKIDEEGRRVYQPLPDMSSFSTVEEAKAYGIKRYGEGKFDIIELRQPKPTNNNFNFS